MVRTKLLEEAEEGLRESSESVPLLLVVVEEEDEDIIKTPPSWIDLTIASRKLKTSILERMRKCYDLSI